jgi:hypothetical protein
MKNFKKAGRIALGAMALSLITYVSEAQVGIGITVPQAKLHVADGSIFANTSTLDPAKNPFYDPTSPDPVIFKMKWFHDKSAFRSVGGAVVGGVTDILDPQSTGDYSFASGYESFAHDKGSSAFGLRASAHGNGSFAAGIYANTYGKGTVALGESVTASFKNSFALGYGVSSDADNEIQMGFPGGYKFYTTFANTIGVSLASGSNAWVVMSDVNKKENFVPVNGEDFLQKINKMNLTSWNYKGQDPKAFRHYGPMAQDFYAAFGKDQYGAIGSDTTINQADFDGVNLIAIQALIRKMDQINSDLRKEIASLKAQIAVRERRSKGKRILVSKR